MMRALITIACISASIVAVHYVAPDVRTGELIIGGVVPFSAGMITLATWQW